MPDNAKISEEMVDLIKDAVFKDGRWMAVMGKAIYERYGEEAFDVLCDASYAFGEEEGKAYKKEAGYEGKEDEINAEVVMTQIYCNVFNHLRTAGFEREVNAFSPEESDITFFRCPILDAWKSIWDKPWFMCRLARAYDEGFMHGVSPTLEWSHYAEKNGQEGLARGKLSERIRLVCRNCSTVLKESE